jgi:hypothetical protein
LIIPFIFIILKLEIHSRNIAALYGLTPYRNVILKKNYNEEEIMQRYNTMQYLGPDQNRQ